MGAGAQWEEGGERGKGKFFKKFCLGFVCLVFRMEEGEIIEETERDQR